MILQESLKETVEFGRQRFSPYGRFLDGHEDVRRRRHSMVAQGGAGDKVRDRRTAHRPGEMAQPLVSARRRAAAGS